MTELIALILMPFMQLGFSLYASVTSLMAVLLLGPFLQRLRYDDRSELVLRLVACVLMTAPLFANRIDTGDVLRVGREIVLFLLMTSLFAAKSAVPKTSYSSLENATMTILVSMLLLLVVQTYYISRTQYFGIPEVWYAGQYGTIPDELDLIYNEGRLRPNGTYGEPSYLGFACLSMAVAFWPGLSKSSQSRYIMITTALIALTVRSSSFLIAFACVFVPEFFRRSVVTPGRILALVVTVAVALVASSSIQETLLRLISIADEFGEASGFSRLVGPVLIMPEYLARHPFGVPGNEVFYALKEMVGIAGAAYADNAVWGMFFSYGWVAPLALFVILRSAPDALTRRYVFFCLMFNGAFLSIDKFVVLSLCLGLYNRGKEIFAAQSGGSPTSLAQPGDSLAMAPALHRAVR